ncbi:MAG TPA: contractile injection system protein, VgrG/Pvc8 family, partial [Stellaceae bacterium]|nr:contractile injection system protein, VgrG/Pvc8 family [Stellaceae bacterium]
MAQTQNTNLIRIDTIFNDLDPPTAADGDDPLLLTKVTGSEAMSSPFLYEVTMVRPLERDKRIPLDPAKLIDTVARIGVGLEPPSGLIHEATPQRWILRGGVFQSIESLGIATLQRVRRYRVYRAVIVPPFTMMQREIAFRIFENENPATIIKDMLASFPHMEFNDDIMSCTVFPDLTYCVQYQEDSFNFLSRLMARFGIWYFFDHLVQDAAGLQADLQQHKPLRCSKMVLGGPDKAFLKSAFKPCAWFPSPTVIPKPNPAVGEIASFITQSQPASQFFRVGDFNQLAPTQPAHGETPVGNDLDLINPKFDASDSDGTKTRFQQTGFPVPERNNKDAKSTSDVVMSAQEAGVTIVTGATKNRSFATGSLFTVSKDEDDPDEVHRRFIITLVNLAAYDHTIGANVGTGLAAFAFDWLIEPFEGFVDSITDFFGKIVGRKQTRVFTGAVNDPSPDFILAMAGAGFNNIAKNQLQAAFQPTKPGAVASTSNPAATSSQAALYSNENYFGAGALAQIASFM